METVDFNKISDNAFIKAVKTREIMRARLLTKIEKTKINRGGPDVYCQSLNGALGLLTRTDIMRNYKYLNGKKVRVLNWYASDEYFIARPDNIDVMAVKVPKAINIRVKDKVTNTKKSSTGDYIVCAVNEDGSINRESAFIVTSDVFKKMFYISPSALKDRRSGLSVVTPRVINKQTYDLNSTNNIKIETVSNKNENNMSAMGNIGATKSNKYIAVAQIHNDYGQRVGFMIQSSSGATKEITKQVMINLCNSNKVSNIELVNNGDNNIYLRGNGVKIEDLPIAYSSSI